MVFSMLLGGGKGLVYLGVGGSGGLILESDADRDGIMSKDRGEMRRLSEAAIPAVGQLGNPPSHWPIRITFVSRLRTLPNELFARRGCVVQ